MDNYDSICLRGIRRALHLRPEAARFSRDCPARQLHLFGIGMLIAVVAALLASGDRRLHSGFCWASPSGGAIGALAARLVQMTAMPEMVALFNGFGGMASTAGRLPLPCRPWLKHLHPGHYRTFDSDWRYDIYRLTDCLWQAVGDYRFRRRPVQRSANRQQPDCAGHSW